MISDRLVGGSILQVCSKTAGRSDQLCGCDAPGPGCCGTGNQCVVWAEEDYLLGVDFDADETPDIAAEKKAIVAGIPYAGRLEGWTRLGDAFNVVTTYLHESDSSGDGGDGMPALTTALRLSYTRTDRYRVGPPGLPQSELALLFGAPTGPLGQWSTFGAILRAAGPDALGTLVWCSNLYVDRGGFTGEASFAASSDDSGDYDIAFTDALNLPVPTTPGFPTEGAGPIRIQDYRRPGFAWPGVDPVYSSPLFVSGVVWVPFQSELFNPPGPPTVLGLCPLADGVNITYKWRPTPFGGVDGIDYDDAERLRFFTEAVRWRRQGNADQISEDCFNSSTNTTSRYYAHERTVDHGETAFDQRTNTRIETYPLGLPAESSDLTRIEHTLVRLTDCLDGTELDGEGLPDNACEPVVIDARVGYRCDDGSVGPAYDRTTRPDDTYLTFLVDGVRYRASEQPTARTPVTVEWSTDPCFDEGMIGVRCDDPDVTVLYDPATRPDETYPTFLFGGERYLATDAIDVGTVEDVTWSTDPCEPLSAEKMIATRCPSGNAFDNLQPAEIPYVVDPAIGAGNGQVLLFLTFVVPCAGGTGTQTCTRRVHYQPTTTPTTDPQLDATYHIAGDACPGNSQVCRACRPIASPELTVPEGFEDGEGMGLAVSSDMQPRSVGGSGTPSVAEDRDTSPVGNGGGSITPGMLVSAGRSVLSRRTADDATISLRQLSCLGDDEAGIAACPALRGPVGARYCGECGCGDWKQALLDPDKDGKSKLQYRYLRCPRGRAGFSNHKPINKGSTGGTPVLPGES